MKAKLINDTQRSIQLANNSLINEQFKNNQSILIEHSTKHLLDEQLDDQNLFIPLNELISELNGTSSTFWANIVILIFFLFFFRLVGYLVLRFVCKPK